MTANPSQTIQIRTKTFIGMTILIIAFIAFAIWCLGIDIKYVPNKNNFHDYHDSITNEIQMDSVKIANMNKNILYLRQTVDSLSKACAKERGDRIKIKLEYDLLRQQISKKTDNEIDSFIFNRMPLLF